MSRQHINTRRRFMQLIGTSLLSSAAVAQVEASQKESGPKKPRDEHQVNAAPGNGRSGPPQKIPGWLKVRGDKFEFDEEGYSDLLSSVPKSNIHPRSDEIMAQAIESYNQKVEGGDISIKNDNNNVEFEISTDDPVGGQR